MLTIFKYLPFLLLISCFKADKVSSSLEMARFKTTQGDIVIEFLPNLAPTTITRIKYLIENGFYNNLKFHRVIDDFLIQTGDPTSQGNGGSGATLPPEFSKEPMKKGIVAMARDNDIYSQDSQFFILLQDHEELNGKYTVFGKVVKGLEVAQKIATSDRVLRVFLE